VKKEQRLRHGPARLQGYLDAENRFGAMVRIQNVALMRDEFDGTLKCLQVDVQERKVAADERK